jgi:hypothetical protein
MKFFVCSVRDLLILLSILILRRKNNFDYFLRLDDLAYTRSGDKGNSCNIGVIARDEFFFLTLIVFEDYA